MDGWAKLENASLSSRQAFYNSLKNDECGIDEYEHAQKVWGKFECQTMKDYQDLYLKTDVLILADIFENFGKFCMENYTLDPAHYVS